MGTVIDGIFYNNGMNHPCGTCIHRQYCGQDRETLISNCSHRCYGDDNPKKGEKPKYIPIPSNCPIITGKGKVWSVS